MKKRYKFTRLGKLVVFFLAIALLANTVLLINIVVTNSKPEIVKASGTRDSEKNKGKVIRIAIPEGLEWKPVIDANGGLSTKSGSIYDQLGIQVELQIVSNPIEMSKSMIKNEFDGGGYTLDKYIVLYSKFKEANLPVVMPYMLNTANGNHGIVGKLGVSKLEDLVGKKIGIIENSEDELMIDWLVSKLNITLDQTKEIRRNEVIYKDGDELIKAYVEGKIEGVAVKEPYLSKAKKQLGSKVLFLAGEEEKILMNGLVFNSNFASQNEDKVMKIIEGALKANYINESSKEVSEWKALSPLYSKLDDEVIVNQLKEIHTFSYSENIALMKGLVQKEATEIEEIYRAREKKIESISIDEAFNAKFIEALKNELDENLIGQEQHKIELAEVMKKSSATIYFKSDLAIMEESEFEKLNDFVEVAKILQGSFIQIEGNVADVSTEKESVLGKELSIQRAKAVAKYLEAMELDPKRFIIMGNGISKPVGQNNTEVGRALNRRVDISFKTIE